MSICMAWTHINHYSYYADGNADVDTRIDLNYVMSIY